ncbi:MAG: tRNA (adenosine(37)-N6)-dimethylallyltransferase MiaA [Verrucomicrobia bacterium]|nr:tRNA (adenosine(37)-N6)-dimethylallyltransferase MiaA [Verrucomicrobiota bacterium]
MNPTNPSAFVLVGPTASGKSAVAQLLAEQTGATIVSADSMNIYRGMDIGTAKPSPAERAAVVYRGIDLADPTEAFSVGDWLNAVRPVFQGSEDLIVAGGTGLYVKCLLQGLDDLPAADEALRARAEKMSLAELQAEAQKTSPDAYAALADNENPRRLVRLLEKFQALEKTAEKVPTLGKQKGAGSACWKTEMPTVIGLHVERDVLCKRIAARVEKMYAGGLLEEARGLIGLELSATAQKAIGYAEAFAVLRGELTEAKAKERTVIRTRQLAKRQATWFRTQLKVQWINTADFPTLGKIAEEVSNVWKNCGPIPLAGARL